MDIANKKRTYVWGFLTYFFGKRDYKTFMLRRFYPYIIKLVYYFSSSVKELKD